MDKKIETAPVTEKEPDKKKAAAPEVKQIEKMSLYAKLMNMRVDLQNGGIKKTGDNKYSGFMYYELSDFLPQCNQIACNYKTLLLYQLEKDQATLTLVDCDDPEQKLSFYLPLAEVSIKGASGIQLVGGLTTYTRRYLYMIVFEISEADSIDMTQNNTDPETHGKQKEPSPEQAQEIENLKNKKIPPVKVNMIRKKCAELFIPEAALCERFKVATVEDVTEELFYSIMSAINATEKAKEK